MHVSPEAILSLITTVIVAVIFLLMSSETIAVAHGRDPITNRVRATIRQYPRLTYAVAMVIGMVLGHLLWP